MRTYVCVCVVCMLCVYICTTPTNPHQPPPAKKSPTHTGSSLGSLPFVQGLGRSLHALRLGNDSLLPLNFRSICGHGVGFPPLVAHIRSAGNAAAHILVADLFSTRALDNLQMERLLSGSLCLYSRSLLPLQ